MRDGQLLEEQSIDKMQVGPSASRSLLLIYVCSRQIPTIVVQGRYDVICPVCFVLLRHTCSDRLRPGNDCLGT